MKRDAIFFTATAIAAAGLVLTTLGNEAGLILFVLAYLLRPALREFGWAPRFADEREAMIHSRSGDIAFIVTILAAAGFTLWRIALDQPPEELYELIAIGLAARAVTGLVLAEDYRKAGALIIGAVGFFLGMFILLDAGFSAPGLVGIGLAALIAGGALLARRFPLAAAIVLAALAALMIAAFDLYRFEHNTAPLWLFVVTPLLLAAACLFLGRGNDDTPVPARLRSIVFGALGGAAAVVFALLLLAGSRSERVREYAQVRHGNASDQRVLQGLVCTGSFETWPDGSLKSATLAIADTVSGRVLPAGSKVHFYRDGSFHFCFLPGEVEIDGHLCRGGGHDFMTHLYPDGSPKIIWLARDEIIQGLPCARFEWFGDVFGGASDVVFYPNGTLKHAKLSRDATVQGQELRKGDHVLFDRNGKLVSAPQSR